MPLRPEEIQNLEQIAQTIEGSQEPNQDFFDREAMASFGLNPDKVEDRLEWAMTAPLRISSEVTDYTEDDFEFGNSSQPHQTK